MTGTPRKEFVGSASPALKPSGSPAMHHQADPSGLLCARCIDMFLHRHTLWHAQWDHNCLIRSWPKLIIMLNIQDCSENIIHIAKIYHHTRLASQSYCTCHLHEAGCGIWQHVDILGDKLKKIKSCCSCTPLLKRLLSYLAKRAQRWPDR